jgi:hypothetical protein
VTYGEGSSRDLSQTLHADTEETTNIIAREFGFQLDLNLDPPEKEVRVLSTY